MNQGDTVPTTLSTKYRIGSVSKVFTAVMIFQLIEEKKISLQQKLSDFYPAIPNASLITIKDLLNHQSGLRDYTKHPEYNAWMDQPKSHDEMLSMIAKSESNFKPGKQHDYSSTNYLLLGYIIGKIEKMSYSAALDKRIVSKLALKNTYYGEAITVDHKEAVSYKFTNGKWEAQKQTHMSIHEGAGSIVSSPSDLVAFMNALFNGKLVSQSSLKIMTTLSGEYGHGLFANVYGSKPGLGHNGRIEEFYSAVWYYPAQNLVIAYCTNGINFPRKDIIEGALRVCFGEAYELPFSSSHASSGEDFGPFTGRYKSDMLPEALVTKSGNQLMLETNGATFPLSRIRRNYFYYPPLGYYFEFIPATNKLEVKETDNTYLFKK
jgi:CubicO group peptidase (beta-lactamase class C family)